MATYIGLVRLTFKKTVKVKRIDASALLRLMYNDYNPSFSYFNTSMQIWSTLFLFKARDKRYTTRREYLCDLTFNVKIEGRKDEIEKFLKDLAKHGVIKITQIYGTLSQAKSAIKYSDLEKFDTTTIN